MIIRRTALLAAGVAAVAAIGFGSFASAGAAGTRHEHKMATQSNEAPRLVLNEDFADPDALKVGDTYYAYSTSNNHGDVPFATAPSVFGPWTRGGNALPNLGAWADDGGTWAPHVTQLASDRFVLYYTAHRKDISDYNVECIGVGASSSPAGPFVPTGPAGNEDGSAPLVCPASQGGAIDADTFAENGKLYLLYKIDGNRVGKPSRILLQELSPDGLTPIGDASKLLQSTAGAPDNGVVEAPHLEHHGSHYVLFYSASFYGDDGYHTGYAMSTSLTSGYRKSSEPLMTTDSLHGLAHGPGGAVVLDDGAHILFHGWINNNQERAMYAAGLNWDSEDRPSLGTGTGPEPTPTPAPTPTATPATPPAPNPTPAPPGQRPGLPETGGDRASI